MISIANSIHNHECIPRIQRDTVLTEELSVVVYIGKHRRVCEGVCVWGGGCIVTELSYCSNDQLLIHFLSVMLLCVNIH